MNRISIGNSMYSILNSVLETTTPERWDVVGKLGVSVTILGTGILLITSPVASCCLLGGAGGVILGTIKLPTNRPHHIIRNIGGGLFILGAGTLITTNSTASMCGTSLTITGLSMMCLGLMGAVVKPRIDAICTVVGGALGEMIGTVVSPFVAIAIIDHNHQRLNEEL